jgi:hypothetical protein
LDALQADPVLEELEDRESADVEVADVTDVMRAGDGDHWGAAEVEGEHPSEAGVLGVLGLLEVGEAAGKGDVCEVACDRVGGLEAGERGGPLGLKEEEIKQTKAQNPTYKQIQRLHMLLFPLFPSLLLFILIHLMVLVIEPHLSQTS